MANAYARRPTTKRVMKEVRPGRVVRKMEVTRRNVNKGRKLRALKPMKGGRSR